MEKCEEKMLLQNGKLEKLETELVHVKEENISLNTEIQLNQVSYSMIYYFMQNSNYATI